MISNSKKVVAFSLMLVCAFSCFAQKPKFDQLDEFLKILSNNDKLMGSLAITKHNEEIFSKAVGYLDVSAKVKNNSNTRFRIGSITKTFTAVMIFQLVDENKLKLDTPLAQFFPKIPNAAKINISNLLNHSSGIFNITNDADFSNWITTPSTPELMLSRISSHQADFEPGAQTEYSNTNYILLGYIIEALDGQSYASSLQRRIVDKIGLKETSYGRPIEIQNNESRGYYKVKDAWEVNQETDMSNPGGAGAIVSTPSDLNKFMNALFNGELISESSFKIMKSSNNSEICHGLFHTTIEDTELYASEGSIDGFQSMLMYFPKDETSIAFTANALDYSKIRIMLAALATSKNEQVILPNFGKINLTDEELKVYEGTYKSEEVPFSLFFKIEGSTLMGSQDNINFKGLTPTKQHQFTLDELGVVLEFYPENGVVQFNNGGKPIIFKKL